METPDTLPTDVEAEALPDMIVPSDIRSVFQAGQFLLMLLAACYLAGEIILPIVLAFVLNLVLQPLMRLLEKLHLPRILAALAIITVLCGTLVGLGAALSGPAVSWAQKLPEGLPRLQERLNFLGKPIQTLQKFLHQAEGLTQGTGPAVSTVVVQGSGWSDKLLSGTRSIASGLFTTVLVLFFLLIAGDIFLRRLVEILPRFKDKRRAVHISQQIEADISGYLATIINPVLIILALVFWYWMWGILGAILAVPMLAVTKIICDRVQPLASFGHFIEG
jgi:predicted PurR-regulated permease PerM